MKTVSPSSRNKIFLSVVTPCYNEQDGIVVFYNVLKHQLDALGISYEIIIVDDGSEDNTLALINEIAEADPNVVVLSLSRNFGHQTAVTAGLDYANGEAVITMDSDLQHSPAAIVDMLAAMKHGADVVYCIPRNRNQIGLLKRVTADLYYWILQRMMSLNFVPGAGDFRLMSKPVVTAVRSMRETHRYLRGMLPWIGYRASVIYYDQAGRYAGQSKYTWVKMLRLARDGLFNFSIIPLEWVIGLGFLVIMLGVLYFIYIIGRAFLIRDLVTGWASLISVVLMLGGVQLVSIGILAQYIGMIFEQVKGRPLYFLKQGPKLEQRNEAE
jgi:dolichol-phosphate mannosyltransferase